MNLKTTYIFFGVLVGVLLIVGLVQWFSPKSAAESSEYVFADFAPKKGELVDNKDVESVRIEKTKDGKTVAYLFVRSGVNWELREPTSLRVESHQVESLVREMISAKREKGDLSSNLGEYGLDAPTTVVTLHKGDKDYTLTLGNDSSTTSTAVVYALASPDAKKPLSIKKSSLDTVFKPINSFRDKKLVEAGQLSSPSFVELKDKQGGELTLEKAGVNRWLIKKPDYGDADYDGDPLAAGAIGGLIAKITGVKELLSQIDNVKVEHESDFLAENVSDADMAEKYGLTAGKPDLLSITVKSEKEGGKDTVSHTLLVGKKAAPEKDDKGVETRADYYYARLENENAVVRVPVKKVDQLVQVIQNPLELRDHNLLSLQQSGVDVIDIQHGSETVKLRKVANAALVGWRVYRDSEPGTKADDIAVEQFLTALFAKRPIKTWPDPKDFKDIDKELEFDHPAAVISLWEHGVAPPEKKEEKKDDEKKDDKKSDKKDDKRTDKKDEKKDDKKEPEKPKDEPPKLKSEKPLVRLVFGKRDKGILYVRRESGDDLKTTTIVTISDALFDKVTAGRLAYLSRTLPSFTGDPTQFTISRGGQKFLLDKGDKSFWTIKEPKEFAGRRASAETVKTILDGLRFVTALRLVAENPPDGDLQPLYNLKSPLTEIKFTVPGKEKDTTEEFIYQFGKETDDKMGVFAKMNKANLVFVAPKALFDNLQKDLRDTAIFAFEPSDVKKLKVAFWVDATAEAVTLEMERKEGGNWSLLAPTTFMDFDDSKAESFVKLISILKAEKTLSGAEIPKPEQANFDLKKGALQVEITLAGQEKPVQLTVGAEVDKKSYYVKSSLTGDDVFLVPLSSFDLVKGKPSYFKKPK
jgi:hypothetical protein